MLSVGIVMRTKNRSVLLKRALESVLNQTYPHWNLVVVNDGGQPEPVNLLLQHYHGCANGRIQVIHNPQSVGMEAASNLGLEKLDTDLAVIHDDDDSWSPDFLLRTTQTYQEKKQIFPNVGGVACHCDRIIETVEGNIVHINKVEDYNQWMLEGFVWLNTMLRFNTFPRICFLFDLATCKRLGGSDSNLPVLGDWDFHLRFMMQKDIWLLSETLAFYHIRPTLSGDLGNNTIINNHEHQFYRSYLENKWLREDLISRKHGLGTLLTILSAIHNK